MNSNNKSGVTGVSFWKQKNCWRAAFYSDGKQQTKTYSVAKYGYQEAFELACGAREEAITRKPYKVSITWGQDPSEQEPMIYSFRTRDELSAFLYGIGEADGWMDYHINDEE